MKNLLIACTLVVILVSCKKEFQSTSNLDQFIPSNSAYILQTDQFQAFLEKIDGSSFFQENAFLLNPELKEQLINLAQLTNPQQSLICFSNRENNKYDYTFISKDQPLQLKTDSIKNISVETFQIKDFEIKKYITEDITTYTTLINGIFLASNSKSKLEALITKPESRLSPSEIFQKAQIAADRSKTSLIINHSAFDTTYIKTFPQTSLPLTSLADWSVLDLEIGSEKILINGIAVSDEKSERLLKIFNKVGNQKNELAQITPSSSTGFYSFTYANFEKLQQNLNVFRGDSLHASENNLLYFTREAGMIFSQNQNVVALTATDPELAKASLLSSQTSVTEYRGITIYKNSEELHFSDYLNPLVTELDLKYYGFLDQFIIFSETTEALEEIILNYQNNTTLEKQESYQSALSNLAGASSLLFVANTSGFKSELSEIVAPEFKDEIGKLNLENYPIAALQFVQDDDFAHIHGVLITTENVVKEEIRQSAAIKLIADVATNPVLLKSHLRNQLEIIVQDEKNMLYLFSTSGKLIWKKQLGGRILGKIEQVDLFKNGNLQMAFSTQNSLQIIDRTGKTVKPFPLDFKDEITKPLAVLDYDNNLTYRFVITQGEEIIMYDRKGKTVSGFNFKKAVSEILQSPKHIRIRNKDYIVIPESNGKLNILSRQGNSRVSVKEKIDFSENDWFLNKNQFVSTTSDGKLIRVDEQGKIKKEDLTAGNNLFLDASENTLVTLSENILSIDDRVITLDFGLYTAPKIFEVKGKMYISVTDTQANRVYVFDEKAELLPNFPVYGTSAIDINSVGTGTNLEFVVKGEKNTILVYKK
jgi:hypothetical protein